MKTYSKFNILSILFLISLFVSCKNLFTNISETEPDNAQSESSVTQTEKETYKITGTLNVEGAVPAEVEESILLSENAGTSARSAGITITPSTYNYYVYADDGAGTQKEVTATKTTEGNITTINFEIILNEGNWTLYACAKSSDVVILKSEDFTISMSEENKILSHNFVLKPLSSGNGSINLTMTVDSSVKGIKVLFSSDSSVNSKIENGTITLSSASIASGSYTFCLNFYDAESNGNLLYSTTQLINVFANLETNTWIYNGGDGPVTASGFNLTSDLIADFTMTTFFVDGTYEGDDSTGTWVKPFEKVSDAVKKCTDTTKKYTIYLMGNTEESAYINITNQTITIQSFDEIRTINRGTNTRLPMISSTGNLTLKNVIVDGNSTSISSYNGAGIYACDGTLTLINTTIKNCVCVKNEASGVEGYGGAIYINKGTVTISGGAITGNKAVNGGGIYIGSEVTSVEFSNNCIIGDSNTTNYPTSLDSDFSGNAASGKGGGIYCAKEGITFDSVSIIGNAASGRGGGIYFYTNNTSSTVSLGSNCYITYNSSYDQGGGIYISSSSVSSSGIIYGNGCTDTTNGAGGGIYIGSGSTFNMTGGTIGTSADTAILGTGIYQGGTLKMSGSACVNENDDIYLPKEKFITIDNDITSTSAGSISFESGFGSGNKVLDASSLTAEKLKTYKSYFSAKDGDSYGILQVDESSDKTAILTRKIYVAGSGHSTSVGDGDDSNDGTISKPYKTLYAGISGGVTSYDTIYVDGTTSETYGSSIAENANVTIKALSSSATIQRDVGENSRNTDSMITIGRGATVSIEDITIDGNKGTFDSENGYANKITGNGAGINSNGTLTLTNCTVQNCAATTYGGGIYLAAGSATINGGTICGNYAAAGGGIFIGTGVEFEIKGNCVVGDSSATSYPTAPTEGGFKGNYAGGTTGIGGGIYCLSSSATFTSAKITGNYAKTFGGGIEFVNSDSTTVTISSDCEISENNTNGSGGAIFLGEYSHVDFSGKIFGNNSSSYGAGIYINSNATLDFTGGTISSNGNSSTIGHGIYQAGILNISGSACVNANDDIYLASGKVVNIAADLNETSVATIKCADYTDKQVILKYNNNDYKDSTASAKINSMFNKFSLTHTTYALRKDGRLWIKNPSVSDSSDSSTLRECVEILSSGDESTITLTSDITFSDGTYNGNDMDYGLKIPAGVKLALEAESQKTLSINSTGSTNFIYEVIQVSGELELTNIKLTSSSETGYAVIELNNESAKLTMNSGSSIDGFTASTRSNGSTIRVTKGTFIMNGGTISNNTGKHDSSPQTGGVYIGANGTFIMNGGTITGNTTTTPEYTGANGGGVFVKSGGTFIFAGGTISDNTALLGNKYYCESGSYFGTSEENKTIQTSVLAVNDE